MNQDLADLSYRTRQRVIQMAVGGGCFLGSAFSCVDILVSLYEEVMRFDPIVPDAKERDLFFLSKGHAVSALYSYFAEKNILSPQRVKEFLSDKGEIYLHPNPALEGIEFHAGSLGHLIAVAVGTALHFKNRALPNRVFVLLGDGELNEGSNWEAFLVAASIGLPNLTLIVDRNGFQANFRTESLIPLEPLKAKFEAFGFECTNADGHNFDSLRSAFEVCINSPRTSVLLAQTVRGRGLASYENRWDRWFVELSEDDVTPLIAQLDAKVGL